MANIDIKKLFVKVPQEKIPTFDAQADAYIKGGSSIIDASKIYFVEDGRIWIAGREYGFDDNVMAELKAVLQDLQNQLGDTKKVDGAYVTVANQLATIQGDETTEGSIKKAVKEAVDKIMGGSDIQESLDTIKEISEWINDSNGEEGEEGLQGFLKHVAEFNEHIAEFNEHVKTAENKTNKLFSDLIGNEPIKGEDGTVTYNPAIGDAELPVKMTVEKDAEDKVTKTVESSAATLRDYAEQMAVYNDEQNDRLTTNEAAIVNLNAKVDEHISHNHVFFNENPQSESRNILWLNNNDAIFGRGGVSPLDADTTAKDMTGKSGMIAELSKYNVVDFGDTKFHTNIQTVDKEATIAGLDVTSNDDNIHEVKTGKTVPAVKMQDIYTIATRNELSAVYNAVKGAADGLEERVAANEARLAGIGVEKGNEYATVIGAIAGEIDKLDLVKDAEGSVAEDAKKYVKTTISEANGIVKNEAVDVVYGSFTTGLDLSAKPVVEGIATVEATTEFVKNAINNLDALVKSEVNGTTHVVVTVGQEDGKVNTVAVQTKDIASNHEFLEHKADCKEDHFSINSSIGTAPEQVTGETYEVAKIQKYKITASNDIIEDGDPITTNKLSVWGGIAKLKDETAKNLTAAIEALDVTNNISDANYGVTVEVNETDGKVDKPVVAITPAAYTKNASGAGSLEGDKLVDSKALSDVLADLWETFSAGVESTKPTETQS